MSALLASGTRILHVRRVKCRHERKLQIPFGYQVNTTTVVLFFVCRRGPLSRMVELFGQHRLHRDKDSRASGSEIQVSSNGEHAVPKFLGLEPSTVVPPEETIIRILVLGYFGDLLGFSLASQLVSIRKDHEPVHGFDTPS